MKQKVDPKIDFILCLFLGYFGVHKFYERKILFGCLYFITVGGFCIGWIYDCIKLGSNLLQSKNVKVEVNSNESQNIEPLPPLNNILPKEPTFVSITHPNGKVEQVESNLVLDLDDYVLVSDGSKTYHKCTGCFKKWSSVYQESFNGWQLISLEEAKSKGLKLCNFCDEAINMNLEDEDEKEFEIDDTNEDLEKY